MLKYRNASSQEEASFLEALSTGCPVLREPSPLVRAFAAIVRERRIGSCVDWLAKAKVLGVPESCAAMRTG